MAYSYTCRYQWRSQEWVGVGVGGWVWGVGGGVNAYAIGCGVLATIEQWYPTRNSMEQWYPTREILRFGRVLVTKEKTMKYPTSAMCTVWVGVYVGGGGKHCLGVNLPAQLSSEIPTL